MATHIFYPTEAIYGDPATMPFPQATIFPTTGTTKYATQYLKYDQTADEGAYWPFIAIDYGSGNLTVDILWATIAATTGNVVWGAAIAAVTPNADSAAVAADTLQTEATATDTNLGATAGRLHKATVTVTSIDSIAADDFCTLRVRRVGSNGSDTLAEDALLYKVILSYS